MVRGAGATGAKAAARHRLLQGMARSAYGSDGRRGKPGTDDLEGDEREQQSAVTFYSEGGQR